MSVKQILASKDLEYKHAIEDLLLSRVGIDRSRNWQELYFKECYDYARDVLGDRWLALEELLLNARRGEESIRDRDAKLAFIRDYSRDVLRGRRCLSFERWFGLNPGLTIPYFRDFYLPFVDWALPCNDFAIPDYATLALANT